jgi:hypothetical protein
MIHPRSTLFSMLIARFLASSALAQAPAELPPGFTRIAPPPAIPELLDPRKPFSVMVGDPAPRFESQEWILGEPVTAFEPGKVYLLHLWYVWCDECTSIMPRLTELQSQYADQGLVVIGATSPGQVNTREAVEKFVFESRTPIGFSITWDRTRVTMDAWMNASGHTGVPCMFIVNREGKIGFIGGLAEFEAPLKRILSGQDNTELDAVQYSACITASLTFTHFEQKIVMKDWPGAYNLGRELLDGRGANCHHVASNIAWLIVDPAKPLEVPDLDLALRAARRADELSDGRDANTIDTLARVHFMRGEIDKAVEMEERAVRAARSDTLRAPFLKNLEQYRAKLADE